MIIATSVDLICFWRAIARSNYISVFERANIMLIFIKAKLAISLVLLGSFASASIQIA